MNKEEKIAKAESDLKYFESVSRDMHNGKKVEDFENMGVEVIDELIERQKRIIENLQQSKD